MGSLTVREFEKKYPKVRFHSEYEGSSKSGDALSIRFLGTAGFVFATDSRTIVADPYLNRSNFQSVLNNMPLDPRDNDSKAFSENKRIDVADYIGPVDDVIIGHSHYDHILDAPWLVKSHEARIIGSPTSIWMAKAAWKSFGWEPTPGHYVITKGNETISCGENGDSVRGIPSRHAPQVGGIVKRLLPAAQKWMTRNWEPPPWREDPIYYDAENGILFPGVISDEEGEKMNWPLNAIDFPEGNTLDWSIRLGGHHLVHVDSADYDPSQFGANTLHGQADVLCLCAIGWNKYRKDHPEKNYVKFMIEQFQPRYIIPCHWDKMFDPFPSQGEAKVWKLAKIKKFMEEIEKYRGKAKVVWLDVGGTFSFS